jgi:hypothetical protein
MKKAVKRLNKLIETVPSKNMDERYFKIWTAEQEHTKTRWTVSTFFFSVSFAIFGFSFQAQLSKPLANIARLSGLVIYWFAYLIFAQFNQFTRFLRNYLKELEDQRLTSLKLQTKSEEFMKSKNSRIISATRLLLYFGVLYGVVVIILWVSSV